MNLAIKAIHRFNIQHTRRTKISDDKPDFRRQKSIRAWSCSQITEFMLRHDLY